MMKLDDAYVLCDIESARRGGNVDAIDIRAKARAIRRAVAPNANLLEELRSSATNVDPSAILRLPVLDVVPQFVGRVCAEATKDWETVFRILQNPSEAERVALRIEYRALFDRNIEEDFKLLSAMSRHETALS